MKLCIILRGVPGSGRDEIARRLCDDIKAAEISVDVCFFKGGIPLIKQMSDAYKECFRQFRELILDKQDVVVNLISQKRFHYQHYLDFAMRNGYHVLVCSVPHPIDVKRAAKDGKITENALRKMLLDWEI